MAWVIPSTGDLLSRLTDPEKAALDNAATGTGQVDRLDTIWKNAIDYVRGRVGACSRFRNYANDPLVAPGTIPEELYADFLELARFRLLNALPIGHALMTDSRRKSYEDAMESLRDVAAGRIEIAPGINPSGQSAPAIGMFGGEPHIDFDPTFGRHNPFWRWGC
jgi:hypothetical protein